MIRKLFLIFIGMLLLCGCASATDYYVSPTGNNSNNGTLNYPWATPAYAASQAQAGDTICLRDGTWNDINVEFSNNGTSENPIVMRNYPGEHPKLNGTSTTANSADQGIGINDNEWIIIDGIEVYKYTHPLYVRNSNNVTVKNCSFHDSVGGFAAGVSGGPINHHILMENCEVYNSGWNGVQISGDDITNQGTTRRSTNITVRNCIIHDNNLHNSIDLYGFLEYITLENNTIYNSTYNGIYSHDGTPAVNPDTQYYVTIRNNTITNTTSAIKLEHTHDSVFSDNVITQTTAYGILTERYSDNITIANNIIDCTAGAGDYAIQIGNTNITMTENRLTGENKIIRMNVAGPHIVENQNNSTYECQWAGGNVSGIIKYNNGRVVTITNPQSGRYISYTPVTYTATGTYWDIVSKIGFVPSVIVTTYNYSAKPAAGTATVTPNTPIGNELANFTAESTNGNLVTFNAWSLTPGAQYRIKEDGVEKSTQLANESGYINWNNDAWSAHVYTVEPTGALPPVCDFSANVTSGTAPLTVLFTDSSLNDPTSWVWDIDNDGDTDYSTQNPIHTYSTAGTYTVNLTATNAIGSDSEVKELYITVNNPPVTETLWNKFWIWFGSWRWQLTYWLEAI